MSIPPERNDGRLDQCRPLSLAFPHEQWEQVKNPNLILVHNEIPGGHNFRHQFRLYYDPLWGIKTPKELVKASNDLYYKPWARLQAQRHIGDHSDPPYKLTGLEAYEIGTGKSAEDIAVHIAQKGLEFKRSYPQLAQRMHDNGGIQGLARLELNDVDSTLASWLASERATMTKEAHNYRDQTTQSVELIPAPWNRIYYEIDKTGTLSNCSLSHNCNSGMNCIIQILPL